MKTHSRQRRSATQSGLSLIEVVVSVSVLALVASGILAALIQSRRLTESSIYHNSTVTAMQGYLEQMKNMEFNELPYYDGETLMRGSIVTGDNVIYTRLDNDTPDPLRLSSGPIPALSAFQTAARAASVGMTSGAVSRTASITSLAFGEGMIDNVKVIDINNTPTTVDDLVLHVWVWITPLESDADGVSAARAITMMYCWTFTDGRRVRTGTDTVRTVRSAVPTF